MSRAVEMVITELRNLGDGITEETGVSFRFTGPEHSAPQGIIEMYLKVNHVRKEIPGGNRVVHQTMAATWQPMTIEGEWDDKWGNRRLPASAGLVSTGDYARYMSDEFAAMVGRTPLVQWELDSYSFLGIITDYRIRYVHGAKIGWSLVFSPQENQVVARSRSTRTESRSIPKWLEDARVLGDDLNARFISAKFMDLKKPEVSDLTSFLLAVNDALDRVQHFGVDDFQSETQNKLLLMATTFRRLGTASTSMAIAMRRISAPLSVAYDSVLLSMEHADWSGSTHTLCTKLSGLARAAELDMKRRAGRRPRAIYHPKRGESLERIALRFYGSADSWRLIYDANNLNSLLLSGEEELIIPERRA